MRDPTLQKSKRTGLFCVRVPVAGTKRHKWVPTGEREIKRARAVIEEFGVDRLIHLANAKAVTQQTIGIVTVGKNITCESVLAAWKDYMAIAVAPATAEAYGYSAQMFIDELGAHLRPLSWINEAQVLEFVHALDISASTSRSRLAALKSLFRFANARALTVGNPAELIDIDHRRLTVEQLEPKHRQPISEDDYRKILAGLTGWWRDVSVLAWSTGARLGDICALEWASLSPTQIVIYPSKNGRRLPVQLSDPLFCTPELRELVDRLLAGPREDKTYVWPVHANEYYSPKRSFYSKNFARKLVRLGIVGCTFHSLRTAFSRRLRAAGRTIEQVRDALGHASIETSKIYTGESK